MGIAADGANILLGKGKLYFDRFTSTGVATGERFLGNCTKVEMKPATEIKEKYDSTTSGAPLLKQAVIRENLEITISMDEFIGENLSLVLMGTDTLYTQAATPVTTESVMSCCGDRYIRLANRSIDDGETVTIGSYTEDDDYTIDYVNGRIYVVPGGQIDLDWIANGSEAITVGYTPVEITGDPMVAAATVGAIEGFLRFMADPSTGPKWDAEFWKVSFTPSGVLSLIGEDFGSMDLAGKVLADATNHPTEPYGRLIKRT